jgi:Zn-dependent protease with chaperone function
MAICNGEIFDGASTTPVNVVLELDNTALIIRDVDGCEEKVPLLSVLRPEKTGTGFRCGFRDPLGNIEHARTICFSDSSFFDKLDQAILLNSPASHRAAAIFGKIGIVKLLLVSIVVLAVFFAVFYSLLIRAYLLAPVSYDVHLGQKVDSTISRFAQSCSSPSLDTFFVKALGRLTLPGDRFPHRVIVLNDSTQNAISIPGGTIYLFRGLLEKSNSPDEVLGVLSHELAHCEKRHVVRQIIQSMGISYMITLTAGIMIDGFDLLDGIERTFEMSSIFFTLRYSRSFERDADSLAIERLHYAGLTVGPLDTLLNRISPPSRLRDRLLVFFSTHPDMAERSKIFSTARNKETGNKDTVFCKEREIWNTLKKTCPTPRDSIPLWKKVLKRY